ncbi:MAG: hypothetical protein QOC85_1036 [Streptomyces sp.]|jgi:hypothetical protein|nr:hypothetical protein [Streptomyces sp.]
MVAVGLGDAFWLAPLVAPLGSPRFAAIGLEDFSRMYFAVRSGPLGQVPAELVTSAFFGFHPDKVERYIPAVWNRTTPATALDTLRTVADETLRATLGDWVHSTDAATAADLLRRGAEARGTAAGGRPLFAAHSALPWPDPADAHLVIWHACTLLREFRGDSHIAVLVANGIAACESHLLLAAAAAGGCDCHAAFAAMGLRVDLDTPPDPGCPPPGSGRSPIGSPRRDGCRNAGS